MKRLNFLISLVSLLLAPMYGQAFELWGLRVGNTPARAIARDSFLKGKSVQGECLPYAWELSKKLRAAGISSHVLGYRYGEAAAGARDWGRVRGHAVVVFQDGGRTYMMDNQSWEPYWVQNGGDETLAAQFEGMDSRIVSAWKVNESNRDGTKMARITHPKHRTLKAAIRPPSVRNRVGA